MKLFRALVLVATVLLALPSAFSADTAPDVLVKSTTEEVIAVIKTDKDIQAGDKAKIYSLVDQKVLPHFDFTRMTQLAMGRNWKRANPEQQAALIKEFRALLVRTYAISLSQYRDQKVEFKPLKPGSSEGEATVRTEFQQAGREAVAVDYALRKTSDGWKVFDVIIEGVSLVTNYRSTFNDQVQQNGVDGLIKMLSDRNKSSEVKS
jgi:phospholipid transport system substrate-binding protein